ncbi:ABC transporter permease [Salinivibrio sp. AR640]|uniref:ABC transporter permease n=1 Tax=Salinivibrio sp. AR640 TaxID=1909437 RepID=UPI0009850D21|nr:FtsX-like permease family protein [Salinivibrio sp. AR640]OOE95974.1 ABC transporter permease [Salinivibrio sp. AR640]
MASNNGLLNRWAWRELLHGQIWPVAVALALIITCVFALSALADRIENVLTQQGRNLIAADTVLSTRQPVNTEQIETFKQAGTTVSAQTRFGTMAFSEQNMQLVSVKAVDSLYPLRGDLVLEQNGQALTGDRRIQPGELWLSERVFSLLDVKPGDKVSIGNLDLSVSGTLAVEPELSFNPFSQMPAVMMHRDDVPAAGVVREGSRVRYRYFLTGDEPSLSAARDSYTLQDGERWVDENTSDRTGDMLDRSRQYLSLTVVLVIVMAAATLTLTCQHYAKSRADLVAMLKSLGASQQWVRRWLARQLTLLFVLATVVGLGAGYLLEVLLRLPLTDVLPSPLPSYGWVPWVLAPGVALLVALPALGVPLLKLLDAPALAAVQSQAGSGRHRRGTAAILIAIPVGALALWAFDNTLLWSVLAAMAAMIVLLALAGLGLLKLVKSRVRAPSVKLALSRITRNKLASSVQLGALAISFMLLAIIWLLRTDLLADWGRMLPPDAPNVFAMNIAPSAQQDYVGELDQASLMRSDAYPIVRGRLVGKNGERYQVSTDEAERDEALRRELNFTWRETLPSHNEVLAGDWPTENGVSVEADIAARLGIEIGDSLTFSVTGQDFTATVNSIREVEWRNMRPNFYFIFDRDTLADKPANWLVSFRLDESQTSLLNRLAREYPTVTLLDLRTMSSRIQSILRQIGLSLSVLAGLAVISGLLLLLTLLRISLSERQQEINLYRTLGASRTRIQRTLWSEYGVMALVSGLMAVLGAEAAMAGLLKWGFEMEVRLHPELWAVLPVLAVGLVFVTVASMLGKLIDPQRR